jgi:hypothetical protein
VPGRVVLSAAQREAFEERGLLHLPGLVPAAQVAALRDRVLAYFRAHGLVPRSIPPGFAVRPSRTAPFVNALGFEEVWTAQVPALLDALLGAGAWRMPKGAGQLLAVTYPRPEAVWRLPHQVWHLDYMAPGAARALPGIQVFLCVDRVAPRAGGTLVACGTHRLIDALRLRAGPAWPGRSAEVRRRLRTEAPWLRALCSLRADEDREARFLARAEASGGVALQVVELAGDAGDVFAMHPWLLHAPSENCGAQPRLVLTERVRAAAEPPVP